MQIAKKPVTSVAMLAMMLAAAVPATAREAAGEISATGTIQAADPGTNGGATHFVYAEGTDGVGYFLNEGGADLDAYAGGPQRVPVTGVPQGTFGGSRVLYATGAVPQEGGYTVEERGIGFELAAEGGSPADAAFSGSGPIADEQYEDGGGTAGAAGIDPNEDGAVDETDGRFAARTSEAGAEATSEEGTLPDAGGILPLAGAGLLVSAVGLLIRRSKQ